MKIYRFKRCPRKSIHFLKHGPEKTDHRKKRVGRSFGRKKNRSHHADQNHITDRITAGRRPIIDRTAWAAMVPLKTKPFGWAFSGTVAAHSVVRSVMGQPPAVVRSVIGFWRRSTICYFFSAKTTLNFLMGGGS